VSAAVAVVVAVAVVSLGVVAVMLDFAAAEANAIDSSIEKTRSCHLLVHLLLEVALLSIIKDGHELHGAESHFESTTHLKHNV